MKNIVSLVQEYLDNSENPSWDDFREKHPNIEKWEYEMGVKAYQEM